MKKIFLFISVIIILPAIAKSQTWNCGSEGSSVICTLQDDGTMIVSGDGRMGDYYENKDVGKAVDRPWEDNANEIKKIVISEGVTRVGAGAFRNLQNLESIYISDSVESLGNYAFQYAGKLKSVSIPNAQIAAQVFYGASNLEFAQFKDDAIVGSNVFAGTKIPSCSNNHISCGVCNDYIKNGLGCVKDCGAGYLGKEGRCISAANGCGENYRQIETWCNRIRYTPAEAAEVLHDGSDNEIIMTFKVNR